MAAGRKQHWPKGWKPSKMPDTLKKEDIRKLTVWMTAVCEWGEHLRDDLIRVESGQGQAGGDPGDPPPPPWWLENDG